MAETNLIRRSEVVEAIDNIDWYHQNSNKDMVSGASNEHEAWYKAEDIYRALESVPSAQPETCDTCKHGYFGNMQCDNCCERYPSHYERRTDE